MEFLERCDLPLDFVDFLLDWFEGGRGSWDDVWGGATAVPWEIEESGWWVRLAHALRITLSLMVVKTGEAEPGDAIMLVKVEEFATAALWLGV